jgi:hypothetical protein
VAKPSRARAELKARFSYAEQTYPRKGSVFLPYRWRMSVRLIFVLLVQEFVFIGIGRVGAFAFVPLRLLMIATWLVGGGWLHWVYFAS